MLDLNYIQMNRTEDYNSNMIKQDYSNSDSFQIVFAN